MRLNKLEISGFKSFAKPISLEFPVSVSAIVGPNGSGKSNVAEAIRWVMGEQSMKSLRGKRGEDLIFNGSPVAPRLGKASVALSFENADGKIPVDFPEVKIERRIFRDGTNEYLLNGSAVRLKDIVELAARIGLGDTKHNIISQGEVDRWLLSSVKDRKEILEEALGLKVYQLKKAEAERKSAATAENLKQTESLLRELAPHLKFLKNQSEKAEARGKLEIELTRLEQVYFAKIADEIRKRESAIAEEIAPVEAELSEIGASIGDLELRIRACEAGPAADIKTSDLEREARSLEEKRQELERELGRTEGKSSVLREKLARPFLRLADGLYIKEQIVNLLSLLKTANPAEARVRLDQAIVGLEALVRDIEKGSVEVPHDTMVRTDLIALENASQTMEVELLAARDRLSAIKEKLRADAELRRTREADLRRLERELRETEGRRNLLRTQVERAGFERENLAVRRGEFMKELALAGVSESSLTSIAEAEMARHPIPPDMFRKIERLRGKIEEIGGIDETVIREYNETAARFEFLTKESADIKAASAALGELIAKLEAQIAADFDRGFKKVNESFDRYFKIIFGGGSAKLLYQELERKKTDAEEAMGAGAEEAEKAEIEYGIDIDVDIPRKRIKSLAMLSGGERALTSIALLFAMVAVNPPPFLVLDETDAALDEANSKKYAQTLAELAKQTQLIIITHNRETMSRAEVLYGVTMGDDGVSKLLSIKLEDSEKYANR